MSNKKLLYFADPMCSWCWGFSPVIHSVVEAYCETVSVDIRLGGLRAGNNKVMSAEQRLYILNHWFSVNEASNQPFDFSFNMPAGFIYDTEPACRAVKTMQNLHQDQALNYFSSIQHAFYTQNNDVTQLDVLSEIAEKHDVSQSSFELTFNSDDLIQQTHMDFALTQQLRVNGFPSVIGQSGDHLTFLSQGFVLYEQIENNINKWLESLPMLEPTQA